MCMVYPCYCFVDGLSYKCINVYKKFQLTNNDCLPILVLLYIMLAYLMLFAALSNAVCLYNAYFFAIDFLQMLLVFMLCLGLLTHGLFIVNIILDHAHCF